MWGHVKPAYQISYTQCRLVLGNRHTITRIPTEFVFVGYEVQLQRGSVWETWTIAATGEPRSVTFNCPCATNKTVECWGHMDATA